MSLVQWLGCVFDTHERQKDRSLVIMTIPIPQNTINIQIHHFKTTFICPRSSAGVSDSVRCSVSSGIPHYCTPPVTQNGPENPSMNLVFSCEETDWWGHTSGGSITPTFYIAAPTAKICSSTPQIQKRVWFKQSKRALYAVYTYHWSILPAISPIERHQTIEFVNLIERKWRICTEERFDLEDQNFHWYRFGCILSIQNGTVHKTRCLMPFNGGNGRQDGLVLSVDSI